MPVQPIPQSDVCEGCCVEHKAQEARLTAGECPTILLSSSGVVFHASEALSPGRFIANLLLLLNVEAARREPVRWMGHERCDLAKGCVMASECFHVG